MEIVAIGSIIVAAVSFVFLPAACCFGPMGVFLSCSLSVPAAIMGYLARRGLTNPGQKSFRSAATAGMIVAGVSALLSILLMLPMLGLIAAPEILKHLPAPPDR